MQKNRHRLIWLDLVRGLSAIAVCAGHLRAAIIVDYSVAGQSSSILQKAFYLATGFGHQAVMVFFVLSGYLVGGSILRAGNSFDWARYAIARLSRLWVVLVPALFVTAVVDALLLRLAPQVLRGDYYWIWNSGPSPDKIYSTSITTFFGNILFLQTILTPVWGTNGPLWSLANEFWYYVLFPIFAASLGLCVSGDYPRSFRLKTILGLFAFTLFIALPSGIQQGYFIWLLGVVAYVVSNRVSAVLSSVGLFASSVLFASSLFYSKSALLQYRIGVSSDIAVGSGFCVLCISLVNLPMPEGLGGLLNRLFHGLSEISYSLYLIHFPIVALIGGKYYGANKIALNYHGYIQFLGWLSAILTIGFAFWWMFERRTDRVRRFAVRSLIGSVPSV